MFRSTGPRLDQRAELLPESADTFFALTNDARIRFVRGPDGKVVEAVLESGGKQMRAARR